MFNTKRIVVTSALVVSILLMVVYASGQTPASKKQKQKDNRVAATANDSASTVTRLVPGFSSLILVRNRIRTQTIGLTTSIYSTPAVNRPTSTFNTAPQQATSLATDSQRASAGIGGEKTPTITLPAPSAPAATSNTTTTSSTTTTTSVPAKLAPPSAPNKIQ